MENEKEDGIDPDLVFGRVMREHEGEARSYAARQIERAHLYKRPKEAWMWFKVYELIRASEEVRFRRYRRRSKVKRTGTYAGVERMTRN
ncbi:hypothetical protein GOB93_20525 [Acetobacter musti]|uniref:Uncharacterized protein n=1 Tax=Acetobacter musti TaxID=864732 RepID=A0ABX0JUB4_9PROT|nr:hypothetical protein [Acetobacter musti]NHN86942.1 hypothetical protein [Acetobacter musti]